MLPSTARIPQGEKKYWKPTTSESFDGLVVQAVVYNLFFFNN